MRDLRAESAAEDQPRGLLQRDGQLEQDASQGESQARREPGSGCGFKRRLAQGEHEDGIEPAWADRVGEHDCADLLACVRDFGCDVWAR